MQDNIHIYDKSTYDKVEIYFGMNSKIFIIEPAIRNG